MEYFQNKDLEIMDSTSLCENFEREFATIKITSSNIIEKSTVVIELCHGFLKDLRALLLREGFENTLDEINFFKNVKPKAITPLIYFSEIRSFEIQFPKANIDCQKKYLRHKINKLNRFFNRNLEFEHYVNGRYSHFDTQYYTRDSLETYHLICSDFYFQEKDFSTSRDMLLSKIKAYTQLATYLDGRLHNLKFQSVATEIPLLKMDKLIWPFTNTDWVELVYALSYAGVAKQNRLSITDISKNMQEVFDFTPKDIYKTYQDIKNRKNSRTMFLDELSICLLSEMGKSEE